MKQKLLLLLLFLGICYVGWADEWEDPEYPGVIYVYDVNSQAKVKRGSTNAAGCPNATGDIVIRSSFEVDGNTYNVLGISNYAFRNNDAITSITISDGIEYIGFNSFENCINLQSITIPSTVTDIYQDAFKNCQSLTSIDLSAIRLYSGCFSDCTRLSSVTLHEGLTDLHGNAFGNCTSLTSINLPSTLNSFFEGVFRGCTSLTSITVTEGSDYLRSEDGIIFSSIEGDGTFPILSCFPAGKVGNYTIPAGVTAIEEYAFAGTSLSKVEIPAEFTEVPDNCFYNSESLEAIELHEGLETIGQYAFRGCTHLNDVYIPTTVTTIKNNAFRNCTQLNNVSIPSSVTSIGSNTFYGCSSMKYVVFEGTTPPTTIGTTIFSNTDDDLAIYVPDDCVNAYKEVLTDYADKVQAIPDVTLNGVKYYHVFPTSGVACSVCGSAKAHYHVGDKSDGGGFDLATMPEDGKINVLGELNGIPVRVITMNSFRNATAIKEVQISDDIVSIHQGAFWGCTELRSINLPSKIDVIASYAFRDCQNLTSINIPEQVKTIGTFSFYNCAALESVTFPEGVTDINGRSFQKCRSLTSVNIPASVTFLYGDAFRQCSSLVAINVDESNSKYLDIDGVLFLKSVAGPLTLQCYPAGKADESYTLPTNVKSVASNAFMESLVKKINIPSGELKTIESNAFGYADELEEVYISEGVEKVRDGFIYCHSLRHVEIPSSVTVIESGTFFDCTALREVIFKGMTPPEIEKYTFDKEDEVTHGEVSNEIVRLYVPASAINAYIAALEADSDKPKVRGLLNVSFDNESEWATLLTSDYGDETYQLGVPEGTKAYVVTGTDGSAVQTTEIEYLPKGVPVLLKKTGEVGEYIGAARVAVADMTDEQKAVAELADGSIFKGVEEPTDIADISGTKYVLYKDKFIETTSGTLPKNRCYLLLDEAGARVMNIVTDNEATGIARVADDENGEKWYSLDGRSLQGKPARKGLYIRNGKKVVVK